MTSIITLVSLLMVMFGPNERRVKEMASMSNLYYTDSLTPAYTVSL